MPGGSPSCSRHRSRGRRGKLRAVADITQQVIDALGEPAARELLDVLTRSEEDRAAVIGRLFQRDDMQIVAQALTDLEEDEFTRMQLIVALRERLD
jgi:hypothetical protein